jgi:hypothetical protein
MNIAMIAVGVLRWVLKTLRLLDMIQVVSLYTSMGKSGIHIYTMRKTASGKYLMRISPTKAKKIATSKSGGLFLRKVDRGFMVEEGTYFSSENEQAEEYAAMMNAGASPLDFESEFNAGYSLIKMDRPVHTQTRMDAMMMDLLINNGSPVQGAEFVADGGYGTSWVAVAFAPY